MLDLFNSHFGVSLLTILTVSGPLTTQVELRSFTNTATGHSVSSAGDVNNDGFIDVISGGMNIAKVHSGRDGRVLFTFRRLTAFGDSFFQVAGGVDLNSDSIPDVVIGAGRAGEHDLAHGNGRVSAYSGKDGAHLWTRWGFWPGDQLGSSVAILGDLDMDGTRDLIVGAPSAPNNQFYGYVQILSGKNGKMLFFDTGDRVPHQLGHSVAYAGDVDQDGYPDFIAGGQQRSVYKVWSGKEGKLLYSRTLSMGIDGAVTGGQDFDGDGHDDFVAGVAQRATIFSGKTGISLGTIDVNGVLIAAACTTPDLNGDGVPDLGLGAIGNNSSDPGSVAFFSGKDRSLLFRINGSRNFGKSLAHIGDMNHDGIPDFAIGNPDNGGSIRIISGDSRSLRIDWTEISLSRGGAQEFFLEAPAPHAKKAYILLGSRTGTTPGIQIGSLTLPLNLDSYLLLTLTNPNRHIAYAVGILGSSGEARARFDLPMGLPASLVGTQLHHAFLVTNLFPFSIDYASNAVPLMLTN